MQLWKNWTYEVIWLTCTVMIWKVPWKNVILSKKSNEDRAVLFLKVIHQGYILKTRKTFKIRWENIEKNAGELALLIRLWCWTHTYKFPYSKENKAWLENGNTRCLCLWYIAKYEDKQAKQLQHCWVISWYMKE